MNNRDIKYNSKVGKELATLETIRCWKSSENVSTGPHHPCLPQYKANTIRCLLFSRPSYNHFTWTISFKQPSSASGIHVLCLRCGNRSTENLSSWCKVTQLLRDTMNILKWMRVQTANHLSAPILWSTLASLLKASHLLMVLVNADGEGEESR